jgi:iron complex transport system substrate-binding protein
LIIGMGAVDHLVAVSSFDTKRPEIAGLPVAGDYESTDWESLSAVKPAVLIVQMEESRIPQGFREHAASLGVTIVNVQIERLEDITRTMRQIGSAMNESAKADDAVQRFDGQLDAVRKRVARLPTVRTLICLNESGTSAAGPGTFLDDLLTIAGGQNVLASTSTHWPHIDRERIAALAPAAVLILLPAATPQVLQASDEQWKTTGTKTCTIADSWALTPGYEMSELAQRFAATLHPQTGTAR